MSKSSLNILMAVPYLERPAMEYIRDNPNIRFLLDSGAFTAWKKGESIKLDDWCKYVSELPFKPWNYFTLDKVGDPKGTRENYEEILKRGFKPVPIFTRGEDLNELEKYYESADVVGIGGLVGTRGNRGFVKGIMDRVGKRKTHWLGFTQNDFLFHYKPYSCDSSSWSSAVRYGKLPLYLGAGKWRVTSRADYAKTPDQQLLNLFRRYEEDIFALSKKEEWHNNGSGKTVFERMCYKAWTLFQLEIERTLGIKYFLCVGFNSVPYLRSLNNAHKFWLKKEDTP